MSQLKAEQSYLVLMGGTPTVVGNLVIELAVICQHQQVQNKNFNTIPFFGV